MLQIHVQLIIEIILFRNIHFLYICTFDEKGARKAYIRLGLSAVNFLPFVLWWAVIADVINFVKMSKAPLDCTQESFKGKWE